MCLAISILCVCLWRPVYLSMFLPEFQLFWFLLESPCYSPAVDTPISQLPILCVTWHFLYVTSCMSLPVNFWSSCFLCECAKCMLTYDETRVYVLLFGDLCIGRTFLGVNHTECFLYLISHDVDSRVASRNQTMCLFHAKNGCWKNLICCREIYLYLLVYNICKKEVLLNTKRRRRVYYRCLWKIRYL